MDWKHWFREVEEAVRKAELQLGRGNGAAKRDMAVNTLNRMVDLPLLPEWVEERIFALLVDFAVELFNRKFGRRWIDVMPADAPHG